MYQVAYMSWNALLTLGVCIVLIEYRVVEDESGKQFDDGFANENRLDVSPLFIGYEIRSYHDFVPIKNFEITAEFFATRYWSFTRGVSF